MNNPTPPTETYTLDAAALVTHEIYVSHLRAGFDAEQAMRLTIFQIRIAHECPNHPPAQE